MHHIILLLAVCDLLALGTYGARVITRQPFLMTCVNTWGTELMTLSGAWYRVPPVYEISDGCFRVSKIPLSHVFS